MEGAERKINEANRGCRDALNVKSIEDRKWRGVRGGPTKTETWWTGGSAPTTPRRPSHHMAGISCFFFPFSLFHSDFKIKENKLDSSQDSDLFLRGENLAYTPKY